MGILKLTQRLNTHIRNSTKCNHNYKNNNVYSQIRVLSTNCSNNKTNKREKDSILPVLIIGGGPVGLVLSLLLTKLGVQCAVLEKSTSFSRHPQAHFINNRSMEIFRKLDGLADEIMRHQPPVDLWRKFVYCSSLTGPILGSVDHMQPQDFDRIVSPVSVAHFSQYKLMGLLIKQLEDIGFTLGSDIDLMSCDEYKHLAKQILLGHECTAIKATENGVTVTTSLATEGRNIMKEFKCNYLVGTDGSGSTVRRLMGIGMTGEKDLQKLISVHFTSKDLGEYLIHERPGMLFFVFNPGAIGVLVAHDLKQGEFVLQVPFYPPQQVFEDFNSETCERIIFTLVGRELSDINVLDVKPWVMHAEVAERFLANKHDRIIIAGDAAHRFPPAGGFGMNTGIQDAHNLAWKLVSVIRGIASPSIISTYEMERKQIATFNTSLSVQNFKAAMAVPSALGLDPKIANSVHRTIDTLGSILPSQVQKTILDGIFSIGRMQLSNSLLNENNPLGSFRLSKLRKIFEEGKSLQLQFPAEDLGFRYINGALVSDVNSSTGSTETPSGRRRDYVPSSDPGSKLPHMNIKLLLGHLRKEAFSTLDLVSANDIEFLLIIAPNEDSYNLAQAGFKVADELKLPLKVCVLWGEAVPDGINSSRKALLPWKNFVDVIESNNSPTSHSWWDMCQMSDKGAILVRPDEHIAWRSKSRIENDPYMELKRVFSVVLGLN